MEWQLYSSQTGLARTCLSTDNSVRPSEISFWRVKNRSDSGGFAPYRFAPDPHHELWSRFNSNNYMAIWVVSRSKCKRLESAFSSVVGRPRPLLNPHVAAASMFQCQNYWLKYKPIVQLHSQNSTSGRDLGPSPHLIKNIKWTVSLSTNWHGGRLLLS
jgi:hypothetical protein